MPTIVEKPTLRRVAASGDQFLRERARFAVPYRLSFCLEKEGPATCPAMQNLARASLKIMSEPCVIRLARFASYALTMERRVAESRHGMEKGNDMQPLAFTESTARLAGLMAARDSICEYVDRDAMRARRSARLYRKRVERAKGGR
jgi:hypothetical protein